MTGESFILKKINDFFEFSQNTFFGLTRTSVLVNNSDNIILLLIAVLLISIIVAPTIIIAGIAATIFGVFALKLLLKKGEKFSVNSLDAAIFIYIGIAGLSVVFSYLPVEAFKGYAKMLVYFGAYLAFYNVIKDRPKRSIYLLAAIGATASVEALSAIFQQIHGAEALARWQDLTGVNPEQLMNRVYGTLKPFNPNLLAGYLIASFSSAAGMFFLFLKKKKLKRSLIFGLGTLVIAIAIVFTGCRGAYIALAGMMFLVAAISGHIIWHDYKDNKKLKIIWTAIIVTGILAVILAIIDSPAIQHRIASIFAARADSSNSFRINVWISSFKMFSDNPLIGIGPGNTVFRLTYGMYMTTGFDALGAYCVPLEIAVESGIFALLAFVFLIFSIVVKSIKTVIFDTSVEQKIIITACLVGIVGIMLHGVVDTIFYRPQINLIFWMLVAIFAATYANKERE